MKYMKIDTATILLFCQFYLACSIVEIKPPLNQSDVRWKPNNYEGYLTARQRKLSCALR